MDAQTSIGNVAALVALIQSLARLELEEPSRPSAVGPEVLAENRFLAARDGMEACLIDGEARRRVPVREMLTDLLEACRPHAVALGCPCALDEVRRLMVENGADHQRALALDHGGLEQLVKLLADSFVLRERGMNHLQLNSHQERKER
jgi:carboxylate-amine ligase